MKSLFSPEGLILDVVPPIIGEVVVGGVNPVDGGVPVVGVVIGVVVVGGVVGVDGVVVGVASGVVGVVVGVVGVVPAVLDKDNGRIKIIKT